MGSKAGGRGWTEFVLEPWWVRLWLCLAHASGFDLNSFRGFGRSSLRPRVLRVFFGGTAFGGESVIFWVSL